MTPVVWRVAGRKSYLVSAHLNSLAVELGHAGRLAEALLASRSALSSPYSTAYPEWRETHNDVVKRLTRRPSRSLIALARFPDAENVVRLPIHHQPAASPQFRLLTPRPSARVVDYFEWKNKVGHQPKEIPAETGLPLMSARQVLLRIIDLASGQNMTLEKLNRILKAIEAIASETEQQPN